MGRVTKLIGWSCAVVALAVVLLAWLRTPPDLTEQDALDFTAEALTHIGFRDVEVVPLAVESIQTNPGADLRVWRTRASVEDGSIEMAVRRDVGQAVFISDVSEDGAELLTRTQFEQLATFRTDPAVDRRIADNILITAAATLCGLVATSLASHKTISTTQKGRIPYH